MMLNVSADEEDRARKQEQLGEACEVAREKRLVPLRQQYVKECVENADQDRAVQ